MAECYKWENLNLKWETINIKWEDLYFIISEVVPLTAPVTGKRHDIEKINKLPKEKKRQIIRIVCQIQGEDDEYISYKYKNTDIKVTAHHINIILNEIFKNNIKVNVQNIS